MSAPRVWAPRARRVELARGDARTPMQAEAGGWWQAAEALAPGADYGFALDGGAPLPDPRSRWQPHGVHGPSRWLDPAAFAWTDAGWRAPAWESAVLYELHIGTFTPEGTFEAAITRLDHLVRLGISHVEVMPITEFSGDRGWGYDGVALFAPHHAYGGPAGFQRFVDACHARGLAVVLDVVYNHLGPVGNYLARFGPYFTARYHTPWGEAVNFDGPGSDEVRAFFIANALAWLDDYHCDGLRLDAVHAILDQSALPFLEELAAAVAERGARRGHRWILIAESDANDPRLSAPAAAGGLGLGAQWNEDFHHALHAALTGERNGYFADFGSLDAFATAWERVFYLDGRHSRYRQHRHGRPAQGAAGARFVACAQNHDQVGNRALGERTSQLLSPGLLRVAAGLTLLAPYVPLLFQGEEWGASTPFQYFSAHAEPELARAVREGRRRECAAMGWPGVSPDPQEAATFARSRLRWEEIDQPAHATLLEWYRALIRIRREPGLGADGGGSGTRGAAWDEAARWLRLERGAHWVIACNLAAEAQAVLLPPGEVGEIALSSAAGAEARSGTAWLPAESLALLRRRRN